MNKTILLCGLTLAFLSACKEDNGSGGATGSTNNPEKSCARAAPAAEDNTTGGCRIRLVTPKACEEIDLTGDKTYEFAWTTDGTNCETPYKAYIGGNPITKDADGNFKNVVEYQINANDGTVSRTGGIALMNAETLKDLESSDGSYEWVIQSFHGSHPQSQVFRVKK